jgi:hypothetical protein
VESDPHVRLVLHARNRGHGDAVRSSIDVDCAFKRVRRDLLDSFELSSSGAMISTEFLVRSLAVARTCPRWRSFTGRG